MSACKYIAQRMHAMLVERTNPLSRGALQQFDLDVMQCELFSSQQPVPGVQSEAFPLAYEELRQLLDLFNTWDFKVFIYDSPSSSDFKYKRVRTADVIAVLERLCRCRGDLF